MTSALSVLWAFFFALGERTGGRPVDLYYTRSIPVAFWLGLFGLPLALERHTVPRGTRKMALRQVGRARSLKRIIATTSFIRRELAGLGFPETKIPVAPNGVELGRFQDLPDARTCRQRLGLPLDAPIVGYIGRFQLGATEKGIHDLVASFASLGEAERFPILLCVGGPLDRVAEYQETARRHGIPESAIQFRDKVPSTEVPLWIKACDVVTIPSRWTHYFAYYVSPLKLFEYMACGVPIVATDLPSSREILRDGETALLVPPGDASAMGAALARLLREPSLRTELGEHARAAVADHTWSKRAEAIAADLRGAPVAQTSLGA